MNEMLCNKIQTSISLWKKYFETKIENNESLCSSETNSYYWLSCDGLKNIILMNPYDHIESLKKRIEKKRQFWVYNKQCLCKHGGLRPTIARK